MDTNGPHEGRANMREVTRAEFDAYRRDVPDGDWNISTPVATEGPERYFIPAPKRISVEEVSRRSGVPVALLTEARDSINRMMNDPQLRARIDAMYYAGNISDVKGFDWVLDADVPDVGE